MPRVNDLIRSRLLAGVPDRLPDLETLRRTERSAEFARLRENRMVAGAFRQGLLAAAGRPRRDYVRNMVRRLVAYEVDHNAEHLLDVANLAEVEFVVAGHGVAAADEHDRHAEVVP